MSLLNLARMSTVTTGTGTVTLGSAVTGFLSFAAAGAEDGKTYYYGIRDGVSSEVGYGVYTSSGTTFTRNPMKSTNSDNAISLSGSAEIFICDLAESHLGLGLLSPSQITSNQNDYSPTGMAKAATVQLDVDAARSITGIATGWKGRVITLLGDDAFPITLAAASASSSAANRFNFAHDMVLRPTRAMVLRHNGTNWDALAGLEDLEIHGVAMSDETTTITTGTNKATFSLPYAFYVVGVYATLNTVSSSGTPTVDINEAGTTIMAVTKIVIDVSEKTGGSAGYQGTAAGAAVISDPDIAAFAEIGFDIDVAGTGAKGLKAFIVGYRK
jgi:hypothetical protein